MKNIFSILMAFLLGAPYWVNSQTPCVQYEEVVALKIWMSNGDGTAFVAGHENEVILANMPQYQWKFVINPDETPYAGNCISYANTMAVVHTATNSYLVKNGDEVDLTPTMPDNPYQWKVGGTPLLEKFFLRSALDGENWTLVAREDYTLGFERYGLANMSFVRQVPTQPQLTVKYPNGGEIWERGKTYDILWESEEVPGPVKIMLKGGTRSGGWFTIASSTENDGRFSYTVPENLGYLDYKVYIWNMDKTVEDNSDNFFSIPFQIVTQQAVYDQTDFSDTWIPTIFDELTVKLNSGAGEGQILFGDLAHAFGQEDMYLDVPDFVAQAWYTGGAKIHLYLHDINMNDYQVRWTSEKGGSLKLSLFFEEDGREILGTWHGDIWDLRLDLYLIPFIDDFHCLHWEIDADVDFEEEIYGIWESWFVDFDDFKEEFEKTIQYSLSNDIDELVTTLLSLGGLKSNYRAEYRDVVVTNGSATFTFTELDPPRQLARLLVKFDNIYVRDDEDIFAAGELYFKGNANHNTTEWSGEYSTSSGETIYLNGGQWSRYVEVAGNQPLNVHFEGYDDDATTTESLGEVNLTFQPPYWNIKNELQSVNSNNEDFSLRYWILESETPPGMKRLSVKFDRIDVVDDEDPYGSGELFFRGMVNGSYTGWSGQYDRDSGTKIYLGGKGRWEKTIFVDESASLNISFTGYDDDTFGDDRLGEINLSFDRDEDWGIGCHQYSSSNGDYRLNLRIKDLDQDPDPAHTEQYIVTFTKIIVHDDNDNAASGELFFYGAVNCDYTSLSNQMDMESGEERMLYGGNWFKRIRLPENSGAISVFFTGYDEDETTIETLGDVSVTHSSADNWGLGQTHRELSNNGKMTVEYKVEKL